MRGAGRSVVIRDVSAADQVGFKHGRWVDVAYWQLILQDLA